MDYGVLQNKYEVVTVDIRFRSVAFRLLWPGSANI
jgi:hypothetical protein